MSRIEVLDERIYAVRSALTVPAQSDDVRRAVADKNDGPRHFDTFSLGTAALIHRAKRASQQGHTGQALGYRLAAVGTGVLAVTTGIGTGCIVNFATMLATPDCKTRSEPGLRKSMILCRLGLLEHELRGYLSEARSETLDNMRRAPRGTYGSNLRANPDPTALPLEKRKEVRKIVDDATAALKDLQSQLATSESDRLRASKVIPAEIKKTGLAIRELAFFAAHSSAISH